MIPGAKEKIHRRALLRRDRVHADVGLGSKLASEFGVENFKGCDRAAQAVDVADRGVVAQRFAREEKAIAAVIGIEEFVRIGWGRLGRRNAEIKADAHKAEEQRHAERARCEPPAEHRF